MDHFHTFLTNHAAFEATSRNHQLLEKKANTDV